MQLKRSIQLLVLGLLISNLFGCASKPKYDEAMLEKYPQCYHINMKIYSKCIRDNERGKATSALDIENSGLPIF